MKSQLLLPSVLYKNYNFSKMAQKEKKSKKEENTGKKTSPAENKQCEFR